MTILDGVVRLLLVGGLFFQVVAALGLVRFPDVFSRLHVTGVLDTLGMPLVLLAIAIHLGPTLASGKLLLVIALLYLTSPLVGHLLSRAAFQSGMKPWSGGGSDP